jgi:AcrR family transcriptional regulator
MATQAERRAATRTAVLEAAHALFGTAGFEATSLDEIAARSGTSKGAIYHHFDSKEQLFQTVFERLESSIAERVAKRALKEPTPLRMLKVGCRAFLRTALDATTRQVLFIDGPRVLGWELWRQIDEKCFLALVTGALELHHGASPETDLRARLLMGAVDEAVMVISLADRPRATLDRVVITMDEMLDALLG